MPKEPLQMCHMYEYEAWDRNSSLCIIINFYALICSFVFSFPASMSGLYPMFEEFLCQAGLRYMIQSNITVTKTREGIAT